MRRCPSFHEQICSDLNEANDLDAILKWVMVHVHGTELAFINFSGCLYVCLDGMVRRLNQSNMVSILSQIAVVFAFPVVKSFASCHTRRACVLSVVVDS